jgi:hypothetical protein
VRCCHIGRVVRVRGSKGVYTLRETDERRSFNCQVLLTTVCGASVGSSCLKSWTVECGMKIFTSCATTAPQASFVAYVVYYELLYL